MFTCYTFLFQQGVWSCVVEKVVLENAVARSNSVFHGMGDGLAQQNAYPQIFALST